jgi:hypothetical protein
MKKNYSFYAILLSIPLVAFLFLGYSSGQLGQYSGSPGDSNQSCALCHSGSSNYNAVPTISTDIPAEGYQLGQTYSITVSVTSNVSKHGFQITAEKSDNSKVGIFTSGTGSQTGNSDHLVTHTTAGTAMNSWTFSWTAPATDEGEITFYAAVNATNSDNDLTGDQIVLTHQSFASNTVGITDYNRISFAIYPNPSNDIIHLEVDENLLNQAEVTITNYQGQIVQKMNDNFNQIDISNLSKGIYFIQIISGNNIGFSRFVKD